MAFNKEKIDVARVLIAAGADVNAEIPWSIDKPSTPLAMAAVKGNIDLVELLLPLAVAAKFGQPRPR